MDFNDFCRVCMDNAKETISVFNMSSNEMTFAFMLADICGAQISADDCLSHEICSQCQQNLCNAYNLKLQCIESENKQRIQLTIYNMKEEEMEIFGCFKEEPTIGTCDVFADPIDSSTGRQQLEQAREEKHSDFSNDLLMEDGSIESESIESNEGKRKGTKKSRKKHSKTQDGKNLWFCFICQQHSNSKKGHLKLHLQRKCSVCSMTFKTSAKYEKHMREHIIGITTDADRWYCDICGAYLKSRFNLEKHMLAIHLKLTCLAFYCSQCDRHYSSRTRLNDHMHRKHGAEPNFACKCGRGFPIESQYLLHIDTCKNRNYVKKTLLNFPQPEITPDGKYVCSLCSKVTYSRKSWYYHHYQAHAGRDKQCKICFKKLKNRLYLQEHMDNEHAVDKPYVCEFCSRSLTSLGSVRSHTYRIHKNGKPLNCKSCKKKFHHKYSYEIDSS